MRPLNFVLVFIVCVGLVLFSLQNTELATVQVVEGVELEAPLALELIAATGFGAILAWLFSLLSQLQGIVNTRQTTRQIRQQEKRIKELEKDLQQINQQKQRIQTLEQDVEQINTAEKTKNATTVPSFVTSPQTDVPVMAESETAIEDVAETASTQTPSEDAKEVSTEVETAKTEA
ncbi:MAG: LapA family protein [Cyanobacteriota bacterium]|nr:LapA family protein [Cyanobacteriota bacterium]